MKRKILLTIIILSVSTILSLAFANNCTVSTGNSSIIVDFVMKAAYNTISNGFYGAVVGLMVGLFNNILNSIISLI